MNSIYIAGPMRGKKNFNRDAFYKAELDLLNYGWKKICNPARIDEHLRGISLTSEHGELSDIEWQGFDHRRVLTECAEAVAMCDAIYMLKGWEYSTGARFEHAMAVSLNLMIIYQSSL